MPSCTDTDRIYLARAIELARNGTGAVKPNPVVGAVVARDGEVLGEGWHSDYGGAHAEVNAIEACGWRTSRGATLYVSLEPCCHEGKTPPCTDAILQAGIRRVVVASDDPTEKASGRGLGILRDEGVEVVVADGELAARARLLNQAFRKHARVGRPWVLFKSAMTLDGKVATRSGDSKWISGEESRELAHRWRASVDAVVVGIGTALADDPQLTARPDGLPAEPALQPRRVVFDSLARLSPASQLVTAAARDAADGGRLARRRARRHRRARSGRRAGARGDRRKRAGARALGARPARRAGRHARCCSRAARISRARSSTPARSTKSACSWRRCCSAAAPRATRSRAKASSGSPRRCARSAFDCESVGEDLLISARLREW